MNSNARVAIVGIGGLFPGAASLEDFWRNIVDAASAARRVPEGRWALEPEAAYDARVGALDHVYSLRGCFLDETPDAAALDLVIDGESLRGLDPMYHLLLHAGHAALHDARPETIHRGRTGVIIGNIALPTEKASALSQTLIGRTFEERLLGEVISDLDEVNPLNRYVAGLPAGLLARALGLGGGAFTLDAACASSLYAVKLAVDELVSGRADAMLAGGLSRPDCLYTQMGFSQLRALSPSGVCSPFGVHGDGLVVGEGAGLFVLKRVEDALRDGDRIYATIAGAGLSNDIDGSLLAPNSEGQLRAMRAAYAQAGWEPGSVDLIECHATGTPVGDAVEMASLRSLWGETGWRPGQCVVGSVKSNIGHLLTAAGSAALMKVLLAMKARRLPPTANTREAIAGLNEPASPFRILQSSEEWAEPGSRPRRAAVSAFGFGGINAHLLIEEWRGANAAAPARSVAIDSDPEPVAVIGLDAHIGPWDGLRAFQERMLGGDAARAPERRQRWWGVDSASWFRHDSAGRCPFSGYFVDAIAVDRKRFRIPPIELEEMLPQQLLMLKVAAGAFRDAGIASAANLRAGVFIGIALDLNTTHFSLRWAIRSKARAWAEHLGLNLDAGAFDVWVKQLCDATGPALNANRTMGALGSIVASRIAREFRVGGPSFTVSSEDTSGLHALETAVRAIQRGELDHALVGAVDLPGDVRAAWGAHKVRPYARSGVARPLDERSDGAILGEGAVALVLKPLSAAQRDGDRVYSVIDGIGKATANERGLTADDESAYRKAFNRASKEAKRSFDEIDLVEASASGCAEADEPEARALHEIASHGGRDYPAALCAAKAQAGHTGAASGLVAVVRACLALYQEIVPPLPGIGDLLPDLKRPDKFATAHEPYYWLRNRKHGPRRAMIECGSIDGNVACVLLEGHEDEGVAPRCLVERAQPLGARTEAIFAASGDSVEQVTKRLDELAAFVARSASPQVEALARAWYRSAPSESSHARCVAFVARTQAELLDQIAVARAHLGQQPGQPIDTAKLDVPMRDRVFYSPEPLGPGAGVAFVFPGSGNHFAGMGRDLSAQWPEVLRAQDARNDFLRDQLRPEWFWRHADTKHVEHNHQALIFGQVALGTIVSDLLRALGVEPDAAIGYSLGETAGLFSLGAWTQRDEMLARVGRSRLFTHDLAGDCNAARKSWDLPGHEAVDWVLGVIDRPANVVRNALKNRKKVYPLIANTLQESVIGGNRGAVERLIASLQCQFIPLSGVTTVHCEIVKEVEGEYRGLHLFETTPPPGVRFYSGAWGRAYDVNRDSAADSILAQAIEGVDYPKTINAAYEDGLRIFIEMGPGSSCARMIGKILAGKPHLARAICQPGHDAVTALLRVLANLLAERVPVDLHALYGHDSCVCALRDGAREEERHAVVLRPGADKMEAPLPPVAASAREASAREVDLALPLSIQGEIDAACFAALPAAEWDAPARGAGEFAVEAATATATLPGDWFGLTERLRDTETAKADAHAAYLALSAQIRETMARQIALQAQLCAQLAGEGAPLDAGALAPLWAAPAALADAPARAALFDRAMCLEFARGHIGAMLGEAFAEIDAHPTRVRLPDEPLMLVDRIVTVEGEPRGMDSGRVVTEHDVLAGAWYLDANRIPTCIAVEAGQADLFLSAYLGIDFITKGRAVYRLLDATVCFHRGLPQPGETIRYDIRIERFFRHGDTYLFRFRFDGTVNGVPLLTMRDGCAGFFTQEELDAGKGIVVADVARRAAPGVRPGDWQPLAPMRREAYSEAQVDALRQGDLAACFGEVFSGLALRAPMRLPGGRMRLVHRVVELDPEGGLHGLGCIRAEADIHPGDWFLTCHFVDDRVMPGTLMYECCLHTFRIFLMRMGWVGEHSEVVCEPVLERRAQLKCRGQVIASTKTVTYEVHLQELGYDPEPYAVATAIMHADGKPVVEIDGMSVRLSGLTRARIEAMWHERTGRAAAQGPRDSVRFTYEQILAYAQGDPSACFGERYRIFDRDRVLARLPRPPYLFMSRVTEVTGLPWAMEKGAAVVAEYDVPCDAWYFASERQAAMPFAVLLEIALQPCGWLAAYMGSALTSEEDLKFRNLGGKAKQYAPVAPDAGTLTMFAEATSVSHSGGMIIQHFDFRIAQGARTIYAGTTYFGFFTKAALADQRGIHGAALYVPSQAEAARSESFAFPREAPFPGDTLRMMDEVEMFVADGGPHGLGFIRGQKRVMPDEWFFEAHFYQDPVWPGSLGIEAFVQLMKVVAVRRWGAGLRFACLALDAGHEWVYRGQVIPANRTVQVEAIITAIDDESKSLRADGCLVADGLPIYRMKDFTVQVHLD